MPRILVAMPRILGPSAFALYLLVPESKTYFLVRPGAALTARLLRRDFLEIPLEVGLELLLICSSESPWIVRCVQRSWLFDPAAPLVPRVLRPLIKTVARWPGGRQSKRPS